MTIKLKEEKAFQRVWERRVYKINGMNWHCYSALPPDRYSEARLRLSRGEHHADFYIHRDKEDKVLELVNKGEDISLFGDLYSRR